MIQQRMGVCLTYGCFIAAICLTGSRFCHGQTVTLENVEIPNTPEVAAAKEGDSAGRQTSSGPKGLSGWKQTLQRIEADDKLSGRDRAIIERQLLPSLDAADAYGVLEATRPFFLDRNDSATRVALVDQFLHGHFDLSLARIVLDARLQLNRGAQTGVVRATPLELLLIRQAAAEAVEQSTASVQAAPLMQEPFPDDRRFLGYRDLLWDAHVHGNKLANAVSLLDFVDNLAAAKGSVDVEISAEEKRLLGLDNVNLADFRERIGHLQQEMQERAIEVRMRRVDLAADTLRDAAATARQQIFAAFVVAVDRDTLPSAIKQANGNAIREVLRERGLDTAYTSKLATASENAGADLMQKALWLFDGLHWWRRGRYGMATEAWGLLKTQAAFRDPRLRFALMMPEVAPHPTDPGQYGDAIPTYARRHHYIWAYEDRRFASTSRNVGESTSVSTIGSRRLQPGQDSDFRVLGQFW